MTVHETFGTTDLGLAVFLAFNGCEEGSPAWEVVEDQGRAKVEFRFINVGSDIIARYRRDEGGFQRYNGLRKHYLRIAHSLMGDDK